jgi:predicted acetyltransferase
MRQEAGRPLTWGHSWPHVYAPDNRENVRLIKVNHQVVSTIAIFVAEARAGDVTLRVGGICGVATLAEYRRRGFAGRLLQDCHAKMRADGCDVGLLSTGIDDWYRRFGWENGCLQWAFPVDRGNVDLLPCLPPDVTVSEVDDDPAELSALLDLYAAGTFVVQRSVALMAMLLQRPGRRALLAWRGGQPVAYVALNSFWVVEYGGEAEIVAGLIRRAFADRDDPQRSTSARDSQTPRLMVRTPPAEDDVTARLTALGLPCQSSHMGMLHVIHAGQLLAKVAPAISVVAESEDRLTLTDGREQLTLDRGTLVKLIFGPERVAAFGDDRLPVPFYVPPLDRV